MRFKKHVFICTNQRIEGARASCGEACGLDLVKQFKKSIKDSGLGDVVRAQRTGCLDACENGPALVVYPEGIFYGAVKSADIEEIVQEHLLNDRPVKRLVIDFTSSGS